MLTRRWFGAGAAAALAVGLSGCEASSVDPSSPDALAASVRSIVGSLEAARKGKGVMFARALYRLSVPGRGGAERDDFDPLRPLALATDRAVEPDPLSPAYFSAVAAGARRIEGLVPKAVIDLYVAADLSSLGEQAKWAKGFDERVRRRMTSLAFEKARRESLLDRVTPSKAGYRWTTGSGRTPILDFKIFNPLDRALTEIDFAMDLFMPGGRIVASANVRYVFTVSLAPQAFGTFSVSLADKPKMNDRGLADLRDPLGVKLKVTNVFVGDHEPVLVDDPGDQKDEARRAVLRQLLSSVDDARRNLFKYRLAFS